ncbi:hypothetical protein ZHAS_00004701 [Anopheles sinensis]|uniref:A2M_recep domain-containing protein n=1 Tax=Anopheles sinensis TaxID=74873 RepID=A0A084VHM9_ANOSI|nr:hypothetical protein ZHAS_00004701 [Anopheles sinensis]
MVETVSSFNNDYFVNTKAIHRSGDINLWNCTITPKDFHAIRYELPMNTRIVRINVDGRGVGLLTIQYEYSLDLRYHGHRFDLSVEKMTSNLSYELQLGICASFIPKHTNERSNMTLVEVNFPSGYNVDNDPISNATGATAIQKVDIQFGATVVMIYYESMGTEKNCFVITAYRRLKVSSRRPAYVIVKDYYHPENNAIEDYNTEQDEE